MLLSDFGTFLGDLNKMKIFLRLDNLYVRYLCYLVEKSHDIINFVRVQAQSSSWNVTIVIEEPDYQP